MSAFDPSDGAPKVWHGGTFNANPLTMAAGIASVEELTQEAFAHMTRLGEDVREGLRRIIADKRLGWQVTGIGSMFRLHPHDRPIRNYRQFLPQEREGRALSVVTNALLNRSVLITKIGVGSISSVMTDDDIAMFLNATSDAFDALSC